MARAEAAQAEVWMQVGAARVEAARTAEMKVEAAQAEAQRAKAAQQEADAEAEVARAEVEKKLEAAQAEVWMKEMKMEGNVRCACPVCQSAKSSQSEEDCTEVASECSKGLPRVDGLVLLQNNSVYRIGDIVLQKGLWRQSAINILCSRRYRTTLMREYLLGQASWPAHQRRPSDPEEVEAAIGALDEAGQGFACGGGALGPTGFALGLEGASEQDRRIVALADLIRRRVRDKKCESAGPSDLVVHLRLGDKTSNYDSMVRNIEKYVKARREITRIVLCAVLIFSGKTVLGIRAEGANRCEYRSQVDLAFQEQGL